MVTKIKIKVIGNLCTMIYEDLIFIRHYLEIGQKWGQTFEYTKYIPLGKHSFKFEIVSKCINNMIYKWILNYAFTLSKINTYFMFTSSIYV